MAESKKIAPKFLFFFSVFKENFTSILLLYFQYVIPKDAALKKKKTTNLKELKIRGGGKGEGNKISCVYFFFL